MAKIPAKAKKLVNNTLPFVKKNEKFKHTNLLPEILQTTSNKEIISSTLDNITSRGSLEQINGYVGKEQGGYYLPSQDRYIPDTKDKKKYNFSPGPTSFNEDEIFSLLTIDDLKQSLTNLNASTNNWNSQLDVTSYTFSPTFDIDKFINFASYFWLDDIIFVPISTVDISSVVGKIEASINGIQLKNGMSFTFTSNTSSVTVVNLRGDSFLSNIIYTVKGVGKYIELIPSTEDDKQSLFVSDVEENIFPQQFICMEIGSKDRNSWSRTNYWIHEDILLFYKNQLNHDTNQIYNVGDFAYSNNIFYKKINNATSGDNLIDNTEWFPKYDLLTEIKNIQAQRPIIEFYSRMEMYETGKKFLTIVDHISVYKTPTEIINSGTIDRQWRNIYGDYSNIDYNHSLEDGDIILLLGVSTSYRYKLYRYNNLPTVTLTEIPVNLGDIILFSKKHNSFENSRYVQEYTWNGLQWVNVQLKTTNNQSILFNLYDDTGASLSTYNQNNFSGNTIFQYNKGISSLVDPYLGFPLIYENENTEISNTNNISFIQFQYKQQDRYNYINDNKNIDILGVYYVKLLGDDFNLEEYTNSWKSTYVNNQTTKTLTDVYSKDKFGNDWVIDLPSDKLGYGNTIQLLFNNNCYFSYVQEGNVDLPINGANPDLFIPTGSTTTIKVAIDDFAFSYATSDYVGDDYFDNLKFEVLDLDGNLQSTGVTNNSIHQGSLTINLSSPYTLIWKLGPYTGKIYVVDYYKMPGNIKVYKNNVLQIPGTYQEVIDKNANYYYNNNQIIFPFYTSIDKTFYIEENGSVKFIDNSTELLPNEGLKLYDVINYTYNTYGTDDVLFDTPVILKHNWKNEEISSITYNKLLNHCLDKINSNPLKEGSSLGKNNLYNNIQIDNLGGSILQFNCNGVDSLINFANNDLDIVNSIRFAKNQYSLFKNNVIRSIKKVLTTNTSNEIHEIVNLALKDVNLGKNQDSLFFNSSMIFYDGLETNLLNIIQGQTIVDLPITLLKNNHLYIYKENNSSYKQIISEVDYVLVDDNLQQTNVNATKIKLLYDLGNTTLKIVYNNNYSFSFCPPTPSKLGILPCFYPQIENITSEFYESGTDVGISTSTLLDEIAPNIFKPNETNDKLLRCHDGSVIVYNNSLPEIFYECILEYEKRIYNNIHNKKFLYDFDVDPEKTVFHNSNFNTKFLEISFNNYLFDTGITELPNHNFDANDPFTWNYSKLNVPGNYQGIYFETFGSFTPDRTPWECLGYSSKPAWWDNTYTWLDTANGGDDTKRLKLINAITFGYQGSGLELNQKFPLIRIDKKTIIENLVSVDGKLQNPIDIGLFTQSQIDSLTYTDKSLDWKFGDFSPIEIAYRRSSDYMFDKAELSYITFPVLFYHKHWISDNYSLTINNEEISKSTKSRLYYASQLHDSYRFEGLQLGINLYCSEYLKFKKIDIQKINNIFSNLNTNLLIKLSGFTNKELIKLKFDTLLNQNEFLDSFREHLICCSSK